MWYDNKRHYARNCLSEIPHQRGQQNNNINHIEVIEISDNNNYEEEEVYGINRQSYLNLRNRN
jgi:hypothetical protein